MQLIQKKEKLKMWIVALAALLILLFIGGCSLRGQVLDGDGMVNSYKQISQEEAAQMMEEDDAHVIVDVRTQEEYEEGHIPGAICIPNEEITDTKPEPLPDVDQVILIYCRSGRRSKEAAEKLFNMGYNHIYEFGGIIDWTGEIEKEEE
ncbi:MAG: rhodanese-like domain-containing protein [Lachnospiraceae bacterium]|nr:rhodanese-like domain-containing protein [Lachnospiraceae bacterium]